MHEEQPVRSSQASSPTKARGRGVRSLLLALVLLLAIVGMVTVRGVQTREVAAPQVSSTEADERVIREAAEAAVDSIAPVDELEEHLLAKFSCEVDEQVSVDGDDATCVVHVTNANLPQALEEAYDELGTDASTIASLGDLYQDGTDDEFYAHMLEVIYRHIDECEDMVEQDVELRFAKADNAWSLDEKSAEEFARAAYADLT